MARDYGPATAVCLYDENSASADNKYDGSFCDSTGILAAAKPGKVLENRIVDIALPLPATRQ